MSGSGSNASRNKQMPGTSVAPAIKRVATMRGAATVRSTVSAPDTLSPDRPRQDQVVEAMVERVGSPAQTGSVGSMPTSPLDALQSQANRYLQEAKDQLEQSGNIKTSIKEKVIESLSGLYLIVLRLNESRNAYRGQLQYQKSRYQEEMLNLKNDYIKQLSELAANSNRTDCNDKLAEVKHDVEALRKVVEFDVVQPLIDYKRAAPGADGGKGYKELLEEITKMGKYPTRDLLQEMGKLSKDLEGMKAEIRGYNEDLQKRTHDGESGSLEQVTKEIRALRQERRTYAQTLRMPVVQTPVPAQHTVIVASRDPRHTADDVLKQIETVANVRKEGIRVDRCRKARDAKVVIGCTSVEDAQKLSGMLKESELTVAQAKPKNPLVEIRNLLKMNTDVEITESIMRQNPHVTGSLVMAEESLRILFRRTARNPLEAHVVLEVSPRLWQKMTEAGRLYIGMQRREVVDRSPLVQCSACLSYGHTKRLCKEEEYTCAFCAEKHERGKCEARHRYELPRCVNCIREQSAKGDGEAHTAFSDECPVRRKWDSIARSRVAYC